MDTPRKYQRRTRQQWQTIINQFSESGLSAPKFCEQNNISYASFSKWRSTLKLEDADKSLPFVEITPTGSAQESYTSDWAVELSIGDQLVLRIRQPL